MQKPNYKETLSPEDYQRFFGDEGVWRNEDHPEELGESPTVSTIVKHTVEGPLGKTEDFTFSICHVRGFHGKGFMATWHWTLGGTREDFAGNGEVYYGTDQAAYDKARAEGEAYMQRKQQESDERMEQYRKDYEEQEEK